jgi:hypothetical protein
VLGRDGKAIPSQPAFAANRASNPLGRLQGSTALRRRRNRSTTGLSTPEPSFFTPHAGAFPRSLGRHSYIRLTTEQFEAGREAISAAA